MTDVEPILAELRSMANPENVAGMARYGINPENTLGISVYDLRRMARRWQGDHDLALALWETGVHEARLLACFIDDPAKVTPDQMDRWAADFNSWDICDQACTSLFDRTPYAWDKALEWSKRPEEFVRRGGFALMAALAWHDKTAPDERFEPFLAAVSAASTDGRNFVKKAVNWALRNMGKRSLGLHARAVQLAAELKASPDRTARWIGSDAYRELTGEKVLQRLNQNITVPRANL